MSNFTINTSKLNDFSVGVNPTTPATSGAPAAPAAQGNGKMSAEQMKAYQDFVRQHPEFAEAMQYDSAFTGFESQSADTVNPALRPGWYHNH